MKSAMDFAFASVGLLVASPLLVVCAVAIRLNSRGPVFFRQRRVGQHGEPFEIFKLRTMVHGAVEKGPPITASGDSRITIVGKWLRRTKIDEIPQLINVFRGEMSLVGPRPELPEYVATYTQEERRVLELKPGLTGPASLAFIDEEELLALQTETEVFYVKRLLGRKLQLDLAYCRSVSFRGDLKLICDTVMRLAKAFKESFAGPQA